MAILDILELCDNNDKSIIVMMNIIAITIMATCIIAIMLLFILEFLCGLEVARKPYLVQTLRLAHNCVRQAPTHLYLMLIYRILCLTFKGRSLCKQQYQDNIAYFSTSYQDK